MILHIIIEMIYQKNPFRVRKIICPQFWGRKWVRQFYGRPEKMRSFCRKSHVHKIPRFRGGGFWVFFGGGVPILFLWARGFFWIYEIIILMSCHHLEETPVVDLSFLSINCSKQTEGLCWTNLRNPFLASTFALAETLCAGKSEFTMWLRKGSGRANHEVQTVNWKHLNFGGWRCLIHGLHFTV